MLDFSIEREIYLGILHMLYHIQRGRKRDCRFCPKSERGDP